MQQTPARDFPEKNPSEKATSSPPENKPPVSAGTIPINRSNARASDDRSRVSESTDAARNPEALTAEGAKSSKPRTLTPAPHPHPPKIIQKRDGSQAIQIEDVDRSVLVAWIHGLGTDDLDSITTLLAQIINTIPYLDKNPSALNFAVATLYDIRPKDAIERLLVVQMLGVHLLGMEFLRRSIYRSDHHQQVDSNVNAANKLLRTFTTQMEALNRHRGKIGQSMMVGSVNVSEGGQAVVGAVNRASPEKEHTKEPTDDDAKVQ